VPPAPTVSAETAAAPLQAAPQNEQAVPLPGEQSIAGLPDDDYAPGRTDQPSTMERLLGTDEKPVAPPEQHLPPGAVPPRDPEEPLLPPPTPPPPPSGWK